MAFTAKLGEILSRLANIVLGFGASINVHGTGDIRTAGPPTMSGSGTYTPPRYPFVSSAGLFSGNGAGVAGSFGTLPIAGNFILVEVQADGSASTTCTDNQGNTYHMVPSNARRVGFLADIWYAYNIGAPSGTFTITVTASGGAGVNVRFLAKQYSGFGANDPLFAWGDNGFGAGGSFPVTANAALVNPNAIAATVCTTSNAAGASLTSATPQIVQDWNTGAFSGAGASGLIKTAVTVTATWDSTFGGHTAVIAVFQDPADFAASRVTQQVQSQVIQTPAVPVRVTQLVQQQTVTYDPAPRVTQILLTIIATNTGECPERPVIGDVLEDGEFPPEASPAEPPICDNPGDKPIISAAMEGGDVAEAPETPPAPCDDPPSKPTIGSIQ